MQGKSPEDAAIAWIYDLVICDEMGYVSFDMEGAELELQPPVAKIRKQGHYNTNTPPVHKVGGDHER